MNRMKNIGKWLFDVWVGGCTLAVTLFLYLHLLEYLGI